MEALQARRDIHNDLVYKLVKDMSQQHKPQDSDSSGDEMEDDMALSRSCLARRKREERCLLVLDVLRRVFITSPGRSATYEQLAEIAKMTLLPSMRPGLDTKEAIENMVRLGTFLLSTRPTEEPYVCSSSVARMWTWQRDTDLPEDELYALSEELTVIVNSDSKVADLEGLADHIPAPPSHIVGGWQDVDDSPRMPKQYLGAAAGRSHHVGAVASTVAATQQEKLDTRNVLPMIVDEFITEFRQQEKERYTESPTMPYEFFDRRVSNRIVVGPALRPGPGGDRKMRDHPMLISERPAHVNLKNLVIDAVARLDGQAGSKALVCGKIRESQYIVPTCSEAQINGWVGGALDRMQSEKWDPAVTFDMDRKLWVYLHADRTVENWKEKSKELQAVKRANNSSTDPPAGAPASASASEADAAASAPPAKAVKVEPPPAPAMPQGPLQPAAPAHALPSGLLQPGPAPASGAMLQPGAPAAAMSSAVNSLLGMASGMKSEVSHNPLR